MREDEPLEDWLMISQWESARKVESWIAQQVHEGLVDLETLLSRPSDKKNSLTNARGWAYGAQLGASLSVEDRELAERLFRQVWERGGTGNARVQEQLLQTIALSQAPEAIPFWVDLLSLSRARDQFSTRRRVLALASLALVAIRGNDATAYAALAAALQHSNESVRALAAFYLGSAYVAAKRALPTAIQEALTKVATSDVAFGPRYQARMALRRCNAPVPLDHPGGAYVFQVRPIWVKSTRTVVLRADQSLDGLHFAIQKSFAWDSDHLYTFFMSGKTDDPHYAIPCPKSDIGPWELLEYDTAAQSFAGSPANEELADDDTDGYEEMFTAAEAIIGELGLRPKQTFLYLFDYGDQHEFEVTVLEIQPQAAPGDYPRLIASVGKAPPQYPRFEDDEEDGPML